ITLLGVFGLISVMFAILYIRTRFSFHQFMRKQHAQQKALQEELAALNEKLTSDSCDPVTQLLGWKLFEDRINLGLVECTRFQFILGVLYIDINSFNLINNAMGYDVGDKLL